MQLAVCRDMVVEVLSMDTATMQRRARSEAVILPPFSFSVMRVMRVSCDACDAESDSDTDTDSDSVSDSD